MCLLLAAVSCSAGDDGTNVTGTAQQGPGLLGTRPDAEAVDAEGPPPVSVPNAAEPLVTPTYDGSGQTVEPTVLYFPAGWRGHRYWMAISPYPRGDATYENPSILVSEDGLSWSVPEGLTNPLVKPTLGTLADATLVYDDASDELWVYYIEEVRTHGADWNGLRRLTSKDGIHWSPPEQLLEGEPYPLESPTVIKRRGEFLMWTLDIGTRGCLTATSTVMLRSSSDGIHWSGPKAVGIEIPGYVIWHLNVSQIPGSRRLLAAVTAFPHGESCNQSKLFLAYTEGHRWVTQPEPLLAPPANWSWDDHEIYRSSFLYDPDRERLRVWYSARQSGTNAWHLGYTEGRLQLPP